MDRTVRVWCSGTTGAKLVTPPAYSDVTNVWGGGTWLEFTVRAHDGAPSEDAVFEVDGYAGSIQQRVRIEVIPTAINHPPVCSGDRATVRSDGTTPVTIMMHPYCSDPDGDDFVIEGGPPGVHPDSPKHVWPGESEANWHYRTATASGDETTTIWATDSLGARSADAELKVTVGPGVDRLPDCRPNPSLGGNPLPIYARPGETRRFGLICTDPDGDLFASLLSNPPARGTLALAEGPPSFGFWGVERWSDGTYVPADNSTEPASFSLTAIGARGEGPANRMAIVPRSLPVNGGGSCGWSPSNVIASGPGAVTISCSDDDGDPLTAELVTGPRHGTVTSPVVTQSLYGFDTITVPYQPDPDYQGYDCVVVRVTDGHGLEFTAKVDIFVQPPVQVPDPPVSVDPTPPVIPSLPPDQSQGAASATGIQGVTPPTTTSSTPADTTPSVTPPRITSVPTPPPMAPVPPAISGPLSNKRVRPTVQEILGTRAVKLIRRKRGLDVWAPSNLARRRLLRDGQAPGLVVMCTGRCEVRASSVLVASSRAINQSRHKTLAALTPRQPQVVLLSLGEADRQALRHLRKPRARFTLSVHGAGVDASLRRAIPIRG